jgi:hypothetical protein
LHGPLNHRASARFWDCYQRLPAEIQELADREYERWRDDPTYPSLQFKKVYELWSARVGLHYRALAVEDGADLVWVWIGTHAEYDHLIYRR